MNFEAMSILKILAKDIAKILFYDRCTSKSDGLDLPWSLSSFSRNVNKVLSA